MNEHGNAIVVIFPNLLGWAPQPHSFWPGVQTLLPLKISTTLARFSATPGPTLDSLARSLSRRLKFTRGLQNLLQNFRLMLDFIAFATVLLRFLRENLNFEL